MPTNMDTFSTGGIGTLAAPAPSVPAPALQEGGKALTHLHGLGTAAAPHDLPQDLVLTRARALLGPRYPAFERLSKTFFTSGVEHRQSVVPIDWFETPQNWETRNAAYMETMPELYERAAGAALEAAGWLPHEVDVAVTVSSTGIATPTLEAQVMERMGLRPDLVRVPVFGLGCAGGAAGLSLGHDLATARPGAKVLVVAAEACTLSFRTDRLQKADIIATVLFGDGAGALCLSTDAPLARADRGGPAVRFGQGSSQTWPDTLAIMGWDVDETGLGVVFDRSIPAFAKGHLREAVDAAHHRAGLTLGAGRMVCHPGGAKVVEAIEESCDLPEGSLDAERDVLRRHGNMSAPTVFFVLEEVLRRGADGRGPLPGPDGALLSALGPGFTAAFVPIYTDS